MPRLSPIWGALGPNLLVRDRHVVAELREVPIHGGAAQAGNELNEEPEGAPVQLASDPVALLEEGAEVLRPRCCARAELDRHRERLPRRNTRRTLRGKDLTLTPAGRSRQCNAEGWGETRPTERDPDEQGHRKEPQIER